MRVNSVEVFFRDEERASGIVSGDDIERIPWTAIRGQGNTWFVVLHGRIEVGDASLHRLFLDAIQCRLQLSRAA